VLLITRFLDVAKLTMYTFANTQHCWQHYVTHVRPQPVFPISGVLFAYRNPTGGTVKLLKKV